MKFLKSIAALETSVAVKFLRTHKLANENAVTKYGPALINQLTALIPNREVEEEGQWWQRIPIAVWLMIGGTVLGIVTIAIKVYFID